MKHTREGGRLGYPTLPQLLREPRSDDLIVGPDGVIAGPRELYTPAELREMPHTVVPAARPLGVVDLIGREEVVEGV